MKYTVIALSLGGKGNKIFNSGDTVTDANFPEGNAIELVKKGFIKAVDEVPVKQAIEELPKENISEIPKEYTNSHKSGKRK